MSTGRHTCCDTIQCYMSTANRVCLEIWKPKRNEQNKKALSFSWFLTVTVVNAIIVAPVLPVSFVLFQTSINFGLVGHPSKSVSCKRAGPLLSATLGSSYAIDKQILVFVYPSLRTNHNNPWCECQFSSVDLAQKWPKLVGFPLW